MELYLQFGYGMMDHARHLLESWGGGTAVLSPRDLKPEQLSRFGAELSGKPNTRVLLDPQFYVPHADHERLCSHAYWPANYDTGLFWQGRPLVDLLTQLRELNAAMGCPEFILPGLLADAVDDLWLSTQETFLAEAERLGTGLPLISTIALSADAARSQEQVATLLERSEKWNPAGYYLVFEHPGGSYLVADPNWLANVLDIVAGLRLQGKTVVVGYCNHQLLACATAKATAICSGTWMNVRSFPPGKFQADYDDEIKQRAIWYYCPQALSEYKIPFLDIAHRQGLLPMMAPPAALDGGYSTSLFAGAQPSSVPFPEPAAFRHYLHALRGQALAAEATSFEDTVNAHEALLSSAEELLATLQAGGIRGQQRDFRDTLDVNRAALSVLVSTRGPVLRRRWTAL